MTNEEYLAAVAALSTAYVDQHDTEEGIDWLFDEMMGNYTDAEIAAVYARCVTRLMPHRLRHFIMALFGHALKTGGIVCWGSVMRRQTPEENTDIGEPEGAILYTSEDQDAVPMKFMMQEGNDTYLDAGQASVPFEVRIEIVEEET